ncbi:uncharacterized protein [Parasteatoda tepidariorum]|uniref:uncharacterized protein isoform X2 n=1 Tax=Parasteatoda tepidariorum TaxID=114398 RepID=UPI001C724FC2|nr:uncharacterized protein LOC107455837 isoform X2 [Parasteatoda tepidariorum]
MLEAIYFGIAIFTSLKECWMIELCNSSEDSVINDDSSLQLTLRHNFLNLEKGLVPGLTYNVTLMNRNSDSIVPFALETEPASTFILSSSNIILCDSSKIVGFVNETCIFSITIPLNLNNSLLFLLTFRNHDNTWSTLLQNVPVRSDCYYMQPVDDVIITSEELLAVKTILIQSPEKSGLRFDINNVVNATLFIHNSSESLMSSSIEGGGESTFIVSECQFLLIDIITCYKCKFHVSISPFLLKYECNSTVTVPEGSFELSHNDSCILEFEAPTHRQIFVRLLNRSSKNCHSLLLGPLAIAPAHTTWNSCSSSEFYISENNFLQIKSEGNIKNVQLKYEFLSTCSNRTFSDKSFGHFCNSGYPEIFFGCNISYFIYVPLGYSIELELSVLGFSDGAFCLNNSLQISTTSDQVLLNLCVDTLKEKINTYTLQTKSNHLYIRADILTDLAQKGFCATYKALPNDVRLFSDCLFGWTSGQKFCYKVYDQKLTWTEAAKACQARNGHLASITDNSIAQLIDSIIKYGPLFEKNRAFWIGANDLRYENCYEWADGQEFDFIYWFPGWEKYGWYGLQPSDDGLSHQNCVELRNLFKYPSKGEGRTERFYWNDRDCLVENPFICQRLKPGVKLETVSLPECNKTINLTWEHPRDILTSPSFPHNYPNNIECHYYVSAPVGQRITLSFSDFVLEKSESCEYDVFLIMEGNQKLQRCGDWEKRIKLLTYISVGHILRMSFSSDFSHSFKGFRVEISLYEDVSKQNTLCDNEMFQLKNERCYLVVNYPETSWMTARQICSEAKAKLAVVETEEEVTILDNLVRSTYGYMSGVVYWVGAYITSNNTWIWIDGRTINLKRISHSDEFPSCLAIQLRGSNVMRWIARNCNHPGRFICQKPSIVLPDGLNKSVSETRGNLTSVNYPSNYLNNLNYIVEIIGPPNSRVVLTFHHFDLEWQEDCLYDYLILKTDLNEEGNRVCGEQLEKKEFMSPTNKVYLNFHSDSSITTSGYAASWEIVDVSACLNRRLLVLEKTYISSLRYPRTYLGGHECRLTLIAPDPTKRLLLTIVDLEMRIQDKLEIGLDETKRVHLSGDDLLPGTQLMTYGNEARLVFHTLQTPTITSITYRGYNITVESWIERTLESNLYLNPRKRGRIYSMNFNFPQPTELNYSQRLLAPIGYKIHLKLLNFTHQVPSTCEGSGVLIQDNYAVIKTLMIWSPCRPSNLGNGIWSVLHLLKIISWNHDNSLPSYFFEYSVEKDDQYLNTTRRLVSSSIDSCYPNPCQHGGQCIRNGTSYKCHCFAYYTGLFCHLTWCDLNICGENGFCNLTSNGWKCDCLPGYEGKKCQMTINPCSPNPCQSNGICSIRNGSFFCRCIQDFEGSHCEKIVMRIPYRPLSQRMLEEPFWLGLITVFSVLLIILCVYCIKRKFADKIEKFLAEEIERSKYQPSPPAGRYSLSSSNQHTPGTESPQTCPKSFISRIRKNSLLSISCSPSPTPDQSRSFLFDNILRRASSKRNKTSTPGTSATTSSNEPPKDEALKKEEEKSRILASLINSNKDTRRVSLDDFFRLREGKMNFGAHSSAEESDGAKKETSFISTFRQSFSEIQSIQEQSFEYMSSSESINGEPNTSEIQADVSPIAIESDKASDTDAVTVKPTENPPAICITIDPCDSDEKQNSECESNNKSPRKSSYLEVPVPTIHIFTAESDEQEKNREIPSFTQPRKYSVDLPKILITSNMGSCDSDEASPPRTPNPNKSMMYLSPLAVISSDRTISESNLSTSGYSSISSPGLSRCNSSSPITDDLEHNLHPNRKMDLTSPKKPHEVQMTYITGSDKTFVFPPTIACHCHTQNHTNNVMFEQKLPVWTASKHKMLCKRNSYQTTSTDDSVDDEGISMETSECKNRSRDINSPPNSPIITDSSKPDLLTCSINNTQNNCIKGSPRTSLRKGEKSKKHRPVISPAGTPIRDETRSRLSSSESDESFESRQKSRRVKRHDSGGHKISPMPFQDSSGPKSSLSESNGDSATIDSRSAVSSSSESLQSTNTSRIPEKTFREWHKMERSESTKELKKKPMKTDSQEEMHPCLRRQEAVVEDDLSDDSSSETTVLLGLQQSSSAEEWEAFNKE